MLVGKGSWDAALGGCLSGPQSRLEGFWCDFLWYGCDLNLLPIDFHPCGLSAGWVVGWLGGFWFTWLRYNYTVSKLGVNTFINYSYHALLYSILHCSAFFAALVASLASSSLAGQKWHACSPFPYPMTAMLSVLSSVGVVWYSSVDSSVSQWSLVQTGLLLCVWGYLAARGLSPMDEWMSWPFPNWGQHPNAFGASLTACFPGCLLPGCLETSRVLHVSELAVIC